MVDDAEFARWWSAAERNLRRQAQRFGPGVEDLLQDVALLSLQHRDRFSRLEDFQSWAHARLRWLALDRLREVKRLSQELSEPAAEGNQLGQVLADELRRAVLSLPPRQREVMVRQIRGESTSEIARALGIGTASVRSLVRFARQALLARLREDEL